MNTTSRSARNFSRIKREAAAVNEVLDETDKAVDTIKVTVNENNQSSDPLEGAIPIQNVALPFPEDYLGDY